MLDWVCLVSPNMWNRASVAPGARAATWLAGIGEFGSLSQLSGSAHSKV